MNEDKASRIFGFNLKEYLEDVLDKIGKVKSSLSTIRKNRENVDSDFSKNATLSTKELIRACQDAISGFKNRKNYYGQLEYTASLYKLMMQDIVERRHEYTSANAYMNDYNKIYNLWVKAEEDKKKVILPNGKKNWSQLNTADFDKFVRRNNKEETRINSHSPLTKLRRAEFEYDNDVKYIKDFEAKLKMYQFGVLSEDQKKEIERALEIAKNKYLEVIAEVRYAETISNAEYLREYGTLEEKKSGIAAIYSAKRAKAETDAERMGLAQEERKALNDVDFDDFMSNRAALAFGEIDKLSRETIGRLIGELEKYRGKVTATFDPDKIEKYEAALGRLRKAQAQSQGGLFGGMLKPEWFRERAAAQAELNAAERTHRDLVKEAGKARLAEIAWTATLILKVKELTGEDLTADQAKDGSTVSGLIARLLGEGNTAGAAELQKLLDGLGKARVELGAAEGAADKAGLSVEKLKEGFAAKFGGKNGGLGKIGAIIGAIDQAVQAANETIRELASTADALGADTSEGSGWDKATTLMEGFAGASSGAKEAFESLISLNPMGVIAGITKSFTSCIKAFAKLHDNSLERKIKQLEEQIEEIERMNKRLEHRSEKEYSRNLAATYEEEARNLEKQRQLIEKQLLAEREKKDPDKEKIKAWEDELEELGWEIEDLRDKALDAILGEDISSAIDNFADKLSEAWGRTGDRARATKDLVRTMLRQMVQDAMKTDLTEPIRKLREMMAAALDDGIVTGAEERELEQFAQALAEETERKYRWADRIMGNEAASQSGATSGSYATASQESVDEVRGRLAAIHTSGELRRRELQGLRLDIGALMEQRERSGATLMEMRGLLFMAAGYLERIARNTDRLEEMNERLESIERNTKRI